MQQPTPWPPLCSGVGWGLEVVFVDWGQMIVCGDGGYWGVIGQMIFLNIFGG